MKEFRNREFVFPVPPKVLQNVEDDHSNRTESAWRKYTDPDENFWNVKEHWHKGDLKPWGIQTVVYWERINRPLWDLLKKEFEATDPDEDIIRSLVFHFNYAMDDLEQIHRAARETWRHDPVYEFVKQPVRTILKAKDRKRIGTNPKLSRSLPSSD